MQLDGSQLAIQMHLALVCSLGDSNHFVNRCGLFQIPFALIALPDSDSSCLRKSFFDSEKSNASPAIQTASGLESEVDATAHAASVDEGNDGMSARRVGQKHLRPDWCRHCALG